MKSKITKKNGWGGFIISTLLLLLVMIATIWISWNASESILRPILSLLMLIVIFYCDNSGIRLFVMKNISPQVPFYKFFSKKNIVGDRKTQYYKTFTYLSLLLSWICPDIRFIFTAAAIIFPVLAIYRYIRHNDRISFCGQAKNDFSPTVAAILVPSFFFFFWGISNHEYSTLFWTLLIAIPIIFTIPFLIFTKEYRNKKSIALGFLFCIISFTFGCLCNINTDFDFSKPQAYSVSVVDKYISSGKSKTLYITVTPWKNNKENIDIQVDRESYKAAINGQKATVVQYKGALNMGWYFLIVESTSK